MSRLSSTVKGRVAVAGAAALITATTLLAPASSAETLQVREPSRPHSADAAERWWASCVDGLARSADGAERWAAHCW